MNPMEIATEHFVRMKTLGLKTPFCLSTVSKEGFPNNRFLDVKRIDNEGLFFGTDELSIKAVEFLVNEQVSACSWWEPIGIQIRILGIVFRSSEEDSDSAFQERNITAKATSTLSNQSQTLVDTDELRRNIFELVETSQGIIPRPLTWWLWGIRPTSVEILEFTEDRIHRRRSFQKNGETWVETRLSP